MLKSSATRGRVERRVQGPDQQGGTGREDTFTHKLSVLNTPLPYGMRTTLSLLMRIRGEVPCLAHNQETPVQIWYPLFSADIR